MSWYLLISVSVLSGLSLGEDATARVVTTHQGPVRGYLAPDGDYFAFYGIPYARAPTGPYKFTAPLPGPVWLETFEAVNDSIICPQSSYVTSLDQNKVVKEDCLIANVYVPNTTEKNLPVLVIVHGGAYQLGFGNLRRPIDLMKSKKIIAITFNYRLGVHGFLCLGTKDAPGNAGMKDQVALLKWVKRNIKKFGGNPDDVTIQGYSAGSSSVDLLMLSKITKGLYNKAIPESGAHVGVWSVQLDPLENAKSYARELGFNDVDDVYALEDFYKQAPFEVLTSDAFLERKNSTFVFSPCVERDTGVEKFLEDTPLNILQKGQYRKVPVLYGFSNMEGLFRITNFESWKNSMNSNFADFLPADLQFENKDDKERVAKEVKEFYFGKKSVGEDTVLNYIDYFTDVIFAYPTIRSTKLQVAAGSDSIYLYEYSYPINIFYGAIPDPFPEYLSNIRGARHCAQSEAILEPSIPDSSGTPSEQYLKHKDLMKTLWLNFITNGKPVPLDSDLPAWTPVGASGGPHMSLGEEIQLRGPLLETRMQFWENIYSQHYRSPIPPPQPPPKHTEL